MYHKFYFKVFQITKVNYFKKLTAWTCLSVDYFNKFNNFMDITDNENNFAGDQFTYYIFVLFILSFDYFN